MSDALIINDKKLNHVYIERGFKIPSFNFALETEEVSGRPGAILKDRKIGALEFDLPLIIRNDVHTEQGKEKTHDDVINELVKIVNHDESVRLRFASQNWYWNAYIAGPFEFDKDVGMQAELTLKVHVLDPYKYAVEGTKNTAISDQVSVVSTGTADSPVTVQATALQNASYYMITKNDEDYFMIGDDDLDKPVEDYTPTLWDNEMRAFTGWGKQSGTTINDNYTGGTNGGSFEMSSSNDAFKLKQDSITSTTGWNGAEYKHSFGKSAQDFVSTCKIHVNQKNKGSTHFAQYLYDTDNRLIASIGYRNARSSQAIGSIVITLFDQLGQQKKIYEYTNSPMFYKWDDIVIYMRLERVGTTFKIKTWKYKELEYPKRVIPVDVNEKQWEDSGKFYQRPIAAVSVYTAKNGTNYHMPTYVLGSYTHEKLPKPPKARDMIIKKGDVININTQDKTVTINEDPSLDLKTFGSDFFNINSGYNECIIYPEKTFDTTVYWQDRYL